MIYMTHPKHGRMPVYTPAEQATAEKLGWSVLSDAPAPVSAPVSVLEPDDDIPKRRGRPPKDR